MTSFNPIMRLKNYFAIFFKPGAQHYQKLLAVHTAPNFWADLCGMQYFNLAAFIIYLLEFRLLYGVLPEMPFIISQAVLSLIILPGVVILNATTGATLTAMFFKQKRAFSSLFMLSTAAAAPAFLLFSLFEQLPHGSLLALCVFVYGFVLQFICLIAWLDDKLWKALLMALANTFFVLTAIALLWLMLNPLFRSVFKPG